MTLSVIVPYGPDGGYRDRAWEWIQRRYRALLADAEICTGAPDHIGEPGLFNRPQAYNRAFAKSTGDIIMLADADTAFSAEWVRDAVTVAEAGGWVMPKLYVKHSETYTDNLLCGSPTATIVVDELDEVVPNSWSGLVVMPRAAFELVGGGDERHLGWGWEDICLGLSVETMWGPHTRLDGYAHHLWHPTPLDDNFGQIHTHDQRALTRRYEAAAGNRDLMAEILAERCVP